MTAHLPPAIQRAQEHAAALEAQLANTPQPQVVTSVNQIPAPPTPAPEPQTQPPQPQPAPTPAATPAENFEAKYKTLEGKYRAEVPRLQQALTEAQRNMQTMAAELNALKARTETPPAPPPAPAVSPKDIENFGAEMVEMVQRRAQEVFQSMSQQFSQVVSKIADRVSTLEQAMHGVSQQTGFTAEQLFYADLARRVPDWEKVNADEGFLAWLADVDPVYGQPRQAALTAAHRELNAERAANVFEAFKKTRAPAPAPAPSSSLEAQVAPTASGSAPAPQAPQPTFVVTQKVINDFYRAVQRGEWRGREKEMAAMEAEINRAVAEGRYRP
jgi:uncharacterized phage infection (PIP) family protein YhgE